MTYTKYIDLDLCCFIPGKVGLENFNDLRSIITVNLFDSPLKTKSASWFCIFLHCICNLCSNLLKFYVFTFCHMIFIKFMQMLHQLPNGDKAKVSFAWKQSVLFISFCTKESRNVLLEKSRKSTEGRTNLLRAEQITYRLCGWCFTEHMPWPTAALANQRTYLGTNCLSCLGCSLFPCGLCAGTGRDVPPAVSASEHGDPAPALLRPAAGAAGPVHHGHGALWGVHRAHPEGPDEWVLPVPVLLRTLLLALLDAQHQHRVWAVRLQHGHVRYHWRTVRWLVLGFAQPVNHIGSDQDKEIVTVRQCVGDGECYLAI